AKFAARQLAISETRPEPSFRVRLVGAQGSREFLPACFHHRRKSSTEHNVNSSRPSPSHCVPQWVPSSPRRGEAKFTSSAAPHTLPACLPLRRGGGSRLVWRTSASP